MAIQFINDLSVTGNATFSTTGVTDNIVLTSTDTSASSAPDLVLYRNAAVADSDTLGVVEYKGKNGMVPGSGTPLTYNAIYSRIADASNNQSILTLSAHKGNGSGSFIHSVNVSAIGTNNSATGAILINPLSDFQLPSYNLDVNVDAYIALDLLINGDLSLDNISNATTDTDKFVVADNGVIKYRTGAQVLSDIGGAPATGGGYLPLAGGTMTGDLIMDANSGSSPDIYFYNVSNNYARMLFDTSNQFIIKIGTTNEMTMSATATTFDSSITAKSAVFSGPSDAMITLNQTGTDTGWSYINFQTSNVIF